MWFCESRVDFILKHPNLIEMMVSAGLVALQIGIESGDPMVLKAYNKRITPDQIEQAVGICYDKKVPSVYANYIIGGAFESKQTIENSMNHSQGLLAIAPGMIDLHTLFFAPYPETPMTKYPEQFGMRILEPEKMECISSMESCVVETNDLTRIEITNLRDWFDSNVLTTMEKSLPSCSLPQLFKITENYLKYQVYSRWFEILHRSEFLYKFIILLQKGDAELSSKLEEDRLPDLIPYRCYNSPIIKDKCMIIDNESFDAVSTKLYLAASGKQTVAEIVNNLQGEFHELHVKMAIEQFRLFENKRMLCFLI